MAAGVTTGITGGIDEGVATAADAAVAPRRFSCFADQLMIVEHLYQQHHGVG